MAGRISDRLQRQAIQEGLMKFELFKELPASAKEELAGLAEEVGFERHEVVLREGEPPKDCFLIVTGEVGLYTSATAAESKQAEKVTEAGAQAADDEGNHDEEAIEEDLQNSDEDDDDLGRCVATMHAGDTIGVMALMQDRKYWGSAKCIQDCKMLIIRQADFLRIVKDSMSREWVEKDAFIQAHLFGMREFASTFVPNSGKSHATHMFAKRRFSSGVTLLRERSVADNAIYIVFSGSVSFYRASSGVKLLPHKEERQEPHLKFNLKPSASRNTEKRLSSMVSGAVFSNAQFVAGVGAPEPFTVLAGPQGCEVFVCEGENFQKLPYKVLAPVREYLSGLARSRLERFSSTLLLTSSAPSLMPKKASAARPLKGPSSSLTPALSDALGASSPHDEAKIQRTKSATRRMEKLQIAFPRSPSMPQLLEHILKETSKVGPSKNEWSEG
mmetsp:Transcript_16006/g.28021  ORF Transcript_16006/g.28021 Transcript_16006/m.28021 type:complete len:444 (+) Transcript_16006:40-1371(+)